MSGCWVNKPLLRSRERCIPSSRSYCKCWEQVVAIVCNLTGPIGNTLGAAVFPAGVATWVDNVIALLIIVLQVSVLHTSPRMTTG